MKVGDLVIFKDEDMGIEPVLGTGMVVGFDPDGDPMVSFQGYARRNEPPSAFLRSDIEVISESG